MEYAEPVLVYDRIDANRRRTWLLLVVYGVILLPTLVLFAFPFSGFAMIAILMMLNWPELSLTQSLVLYLGTLGGLALLTFLIALYITDWAILRLAQARLLVPDEEQDYQRIVENLCIGSGLPLPRLYIIESATPNAFSVGRDQNDSAIAVSRSLLVLLNKSELEGVLAHELSHIGNQDTSLSTLTAAMTLSTQAAFRLLGGVGHFVQRRWFLIFTPIGGFVIAAPFYLVMSAFLTAPFALIGLLLRASISRGREYLADADAVLLTRDPEGLVRALAKIEASTTPSARVDGVIAHLQIVNPLREDASWWDRIFSAHPPIEERIAALAGMGGGIPPSVLREAAEAGAKFTPVDPAATVVATPRWEERALGDEATESAETAPPAQPRRASGGYRLTGEGTTLYTKPDTSSAALRQLAGGALITVIERQGDFVRVLTAGDRFGYISSSASMTPVDVP
ncbi:MAG: M48 family metalloprotease [Chloroflexi bacterium]|nr:M48 family metalloprotease [Chloroflexota bacterium]